MAKKIMQFRYYGDPDPEGNNNNNNNNQPNGLSKANLAQNGGAFTEYLPFTQLGIQTLPGTRFYLNNNEVGPIIIGSTGIYELDLEGISEITDLYFESASLELIHNNPNAYLIIDAICDI